MRQENGKWMTHNTCNKNVHGTVNPAFLTHNKLSKEFRGWNLIISLYGLYALIIDGDHKQLAILFHADNLLLTHIGSSIIAKCIKMLDKVYGAKDLLVVTREKKYD